MRVCSQRIRSVWMSLYNTDDAKNNAEYLATAFEQAIGQCQIRGWAVAGGITHNEALEVSSMQIIKDRSQDAPFANLRCGVHTAHLLMQDVLMAPDGMAGEQTVPNTFADWSTAVEMVHEISAFVNAHTALRVGLRRVMTETTHLKMSPPMMPLTRSWASFSSVVFMLSRFLSIAEQLKFLFCNRRGHFAEKEFGTGPEDQIAKTEVKKFATVLQQQVLQNSVRAIIAWVSPVYSFEAWANSNYESSFFNSCSKWNIMEKAPPA